MRRLVCLFLAFAAATPSGRAWAQQAVLSTSARGFSFSDASGVGLRSYALAASALGLTYPIRPWLAVGTRIGLARASVSPWPETSAQLSGLTDVDVQADVAAGPLLLRGLLALDVGQSTLTSGEQLVSGVTAYELLPVPIRSWGRGGGYALEARVPFRAIGLDMEFLGGMRTHDGFSPFEDMAYEYRFGAEVRAGVRVARTVAPWSRVEVGAQVVLPASDEADGQEVYSPGARLGLFALSLFTVEQTTLLVRGDFYRRNAGLIEPVGVSLAEDDTPARELWAVQAETRTRLGHFALLTTVGGRMLRSSDEGEAGGWLLSAGGGGEVEIRGPWPGRTFLTPRAAVHAGNVTVAEGYASNTLAWEMSLDVSWERGR